VNPRPKSVVQEICTLRSVGGEGRRLPPPTRWAPSNGCPYRNRENGYRSALSISLKLFGFRRRDLPTSGTEVSNPLPSSSASANHRFRCCGRLCTRREWVLRLNDIRQTDHPAPPSFSPVRGSRIRRIPRSEIFRNKPYPIGRDLTCERCSVGREFHVHMSAAVTRGRSIFSPDQNVKQDQAALGSASFLLIKSAQ
jgi:hypothetical protein